jgi:hypothetical protein
MLLSFKRIAAFTQTAVHWYCMDFLSSGASSQTISFLLGIVASFIGWWILSHMIVPRVRFSDKIVKDTTPGPGKSPYKFKIYNEGRHDIISLECYVYLSYDWNNTDSWTLFFIPTNIHEGKMNTTPYVKKTHTYTLEIARALELHSDERFRKLFRPLGKTYIPTLEDLLRMHPTAKVMVRMLATDAFSNARRPYHKSYSLYDIQPGKFRRHSLELVGEEPLRSQRFEKLYRPIRRLLAK